MGHEDIHHNKVADASAHYKQMKNFMRAKILMSGIEDRELQRVNDAAYGVDDTALSLIHI